MFSIFRLCISVLTASHVFFLCVAGDIGTQLSTVSTYTERLADTLKSSSKHIATSLGTLSDADFTKIKNDFTGALFTAGRLSAISPDGTPLITQIEQTKTLDPKSEQRLVELLQAVPYWERLDFFTDRDRQKLAKLLKTHASARAVLEGILTGWGTDEQSIDILTTEMPADMWEQILSLDSASLNNIAPVLPPLVTQVSAGRISVKPLINRALIVSSPETLDLFLSQPSNKGLAADSTVIYDLEPLFLADRDGAAKIRVLKKHGWDFSQRIIKGFTGPGALLFARLRDDKVADVVLPLAQELLGSLPDAERLKLINEPFSQSFSESIQDQYKKMREENVSKNYFRTEDLPELDRLYGYTA